MTTARGLSARALGGSFLQLSRVMKQDENIYGVIRSISFAPTILRAVQWNQHHFTNTSVLPLPKRWAGGVLLCIHFYFTCVRSCTSQHTATAFCHSRREQNEGVLNYRSSLFSLTERTLIFCCLYYLPEFLPPSTEYYRS